MEERIKKIEERNKLNHEICELEFEEKGFNKRLENIKYKLFRKTQLGKNNINYKLTIGILRKQFWYLVQNNYLIIIAIQNPHKVDEHNYYIYDHNKDFGFKNGYTHEDEYINFMLVIKEKDKEGNDKDVRRWLRAVEEYLNEHKN